MAQDRIFPPACLVPPLEHGKGFLPAAWQKLSTETEHLEAKSSLTSCREYPQTHWCQQAALQEMLLSPDLTARVCEPSKSTGHQLDLLGPRGHIALWRLDEPCPKAAPDMLLPLKCLQVLTVGSRVAFALGQVGS